MTTIPFFETERNYFEYAKIIDTKDLAAESAEALVRAEIKGTVRTLFSPEWAGQDCYIFKPDSKFTVKIIMNDISCQIIQENLQYTEDSAKADSNSIVQGKIIDILTVNKSWEKNGEIKLRYAILDCGLYIWLQLSSSIKVTVGDNIKATGRLDIIRA